MVSRCRPTFESSKALCEILRVSSDPTTIRDKIHRKLFSFCGELGKVDVFLGSLYGDEVLKEDPFELVELYNDPVQQVMHALRTVRNLDALDQLVLALERSGNEEIIVKLAGYAHEALEARKATDARDPSILCPVAKTSSASDEDRLLVTELRCFEPAEEYLHTIRVAEDAICVAGRSIAGGRWFIRVYDLQSLQCIKTISDTAVFLMDCSTEFLVVQSSITSMRIYNKKNSWIHLKRKTGKTVMMALSGSDLVTLSNAGIMRKQIISTVLPTEYDATITKLVYTWSKSIPYGSAPLERMDLNNKYIVCGYARETRIYASYDGSLLHLIDGLLLGIWEDSIFTRNGNRWSAWDPLTWEKLMSEDHIMPQVVAGSNNFFALGRSDGSIQIYRSEDALKSGSTGTETTMKTYNYHDNWVLSLQVQNDYMVSSCMNNKILVWKLW